MGYDLVIFGINSFWNHFGIVVVVEDATPYDVGGGIDVLDDKAASATAFIFGLGL